MKFGDSVKTLRLQRGLSHEEVAEKVGITVYELCNIERGDISNLTKDMIDKFIDTFQVSKHRLYNCNDIRASQRSNRSINMRLLRGKPKNRW